jgi:hypothetical protein
MATEIWTPVHVVLMVKTSDAGNGETEYCAENDWCLKAFGSIVRNDISFPAFLDSVMAHVVLLIGSTTILNCNLGLLPVVGQRPPDAETWYRKHPEEWPPWMGMELMTPVRIHKGEILKLKIEGKPEQDLGLMLYGSSVS